MMDMNLPMPNLPRQRVVIIGGGFSGAVVALTLLDLRGETAPDITIIEPRARVGAGLAYSAPDPAHRVNVPAVRLLVHPNEPGAFHAWLESSGAIAEDPAAELPDGRRYPRRAVFGQYVNQRLLQSAAAPGAPPFRHLQATATQVTAKNGAYAITLDTGAQITADAVVLAVSHPPPGIPRGLAAVAHAPKFFANPWAGNIVQQIAPTDRVLIIGTALSTADIAGSFSAAGRTNPILAISRRGLTSRERRPTQSGPFGDFSTNPSRTAVTLLQTVRAVLREAPQHFSCWEAVIESLRNQGDVIWGALPEPERKRFLRHLRPYWDVHRYQLAPQLAEVMRRQTKSGQLRIEAARITAATHQNNQFHITLRHRDTQRTETFDAIINCTGPNHADITQTNPALASLAAAGLIRPDPHHLGIDTTLTANALNAAGHPTPNLYVAGPLARATFGELMGLPQVTHHAVLVGHNLAKCGVVAGV
jgi:uncharacterized NAD(P)/FAD-binding protein YdhS